MTNGVLCSWETVVINCERLVKTRVTQSCGHGMVRPTKGAMLGSSLHAELKLMGARGFWVRLRAFLQGQVETQNPSSKETPNI